MLLVQHVCPHTKLAPAPFRRKPSAHGASSFLRFLFPRTRQRARAHLSRLRHETLPSIRHQAQSRIYRYIVRRQTSKLKGRSGVLHHLRRRTKAILGTNYLENEVIRKRHLMKQTRGSDASYANSMSTQDYTGARETGARRRRLAGYLKAANELRQSYQQQYASGWSRRDNTSEEYDEGTPGGYPDAAIVRSGDEEMILFPSYARKHVKSKVSGSHHF